DGIEQCDQTSAVQPRIVFIFHPDITALESDSHRDIIIETVDRSRRHADIGVTISEARSESATEMHMIPKITFFRLLRMDRQTEKNAHKCSVPTRPQINPS